MNSMSGKVKITTLFFFYLYLAPPSDGTANSVNLRRHLTQLANVGDRTWRLNDSSYPSTGSAASTSASPTSS